MSLARIKMARQRLEYTEDTRCHQNALSSFSHINEHWQTLLVSCKERVHLGFCIGEARIVL